MTGLSAFRRRVTAIPLRGIERSSTPSTSVSGPERESRFWIWDLERQFSPNDGIAITGVDFSREMIAIAQEKMPRARLFQQDLTQGLPSELAGERFDFIVCTYAIHHLTQEQKVAFLSLLRSHLNPGGEILLGDVAFETEAEQAACRKACGEQWDEDELYLVMETLAPRVPGMKFQKLSSCAGVCVIPAQG